VKGWTGEVEEMAKRFKTLSESELSLVKDLESETDTWVVAYESRPRVAEIDGDQLQRLQALERRLAAVLVAYEKPQDPPDMMAARRSGETARGAAMLRRR